MTSTRREKKHTFIDPKMGEEIESTWEARLVGGLAVGLVTGLAVGLVGYVSGHVGVIVGGLMGGLLSGLALGLFEGMARVRRARLGRWVHDGIARRQHYRRQRGESMGSSLDI